MGSQASCILVVDDERFFREAIREILAERGFECETADDGEAALERVQDPAIAVMVLDIALPGIDGIEVLKRLETQRPDVPVIVVSASNDQELVLDALRLGACDYLVKPLHDEELALAVTRAVEHHALLVERHELRDRLESWQAKAGTTQAGADSREGPDEGTADDAELARAVCDAMVSEAEPERVLGAALRPLSDSFKAAPVSLYLFDGTRGELLLEEEWDAGLRSDRPVLPDRSGLTGGVFQTGCLVATPSPEKDPRFDAAVDTPEDGRRGPLLCVPLRIRGKVVGVVRAFFDEGSAISARTGEVLAAALSAAVRNVLLYRSLVESIEEVATARREALGPPYPSPLRTLG